MRPPSWNLTPLKSQGHEPDINCGTVVKSRAQEDPLIDFGKSLAKTERSEIPTPGLRRNPAAVELTPADFGIDENTFNPMDLINKKIDKIDITPSLSFTPIKVHGKENIIPHANQTRTDLDFLTPVKTTRVFSDEFLGSNSPDKNTCTFNLRNITIDDETGNPLQEPDLTIKFKGLSSPFEIMQRDHGLKKITEEEFLELPSYRRFGLDVAKANEALYSLYKTSNGNKAHTFKLDELTRVESKAQPALQVLGRISRLADGCFHLM